MPIPTRTLDDLIRRGTAHFRTSFPGLPLGVRRFLGRVARAQALVAWGLHKAIEDLDLDIIPSPKSSKDALSSWATLVGVPNGAGAYGPQVPTAATGGVATLTGALGTVFPSGLIAVAEDGTTQIALTSTVTIPGSGTGSGSAVADFNAVTKGTVGNLAIGTLCTWQSTPAGADASFALTTELKGGTDTESNSSILARFTSRLQNPPRGGVGQDFRTWVQQTGNYSVYVYPRRHGTGSVDIVAVQPGTGQSRRPSTVELAAAQTSVDTQRPVALEHATVYAPYMPNGSGHLLRVRVVPSRAKYAFDWDDTATTYTVASYTGGAHPQLVLNTLAPQSLKDAITAGLARLQILSAGSNPVNAAIKATSYFDGISATTLTLESVPAGFTAPTAGDRVYAYGPVVATIAANIQAFVDTLGPSKVSGYQDPDLFWDDALAISDLIGIARDATDADGTPLVLEVPVGGATIDGAATDIRAQDNSTNPPEILYSSHVAVTQ